MRPARTALILLLVQDINPGPAGSGPGSFAVVGTTVFFHACQDAQGCERGPRDGLTA